MLIFIFTFGGFEGLIEIISELALNLSVGILGLFIAGYFIGKKTEILINEKKWNSILVGIVALILILLIGILFGSSVGFLQEGLNHIDREGQLSDSLFDYYIKPLFWIMLFGIIPTIIVGGIMGWKIKTTPNKVLC
jgi:cell shape-determining protein MreD